MLTHPQVAQFREQGFLVAESGLAPDELDALLAELEAWIEESRCYNENFGATIDGKRRFDLEDGHCAAAPKLRRVANPVDISDTYRDVLFDGPQVDLVARLIGPDVKFHHCKLNIKMPSMHTKVDWHQDHAFDPHSNDDVVVALLLLDDMTLENGCLMVVPGSFRERHSHYQEGRFTGTTDPGLAETFARRAVPLTGKRGDIVLMHTWCLHASGQNASSRPRRLLITDYTAADAVPLTAPAMPSPYTGRIVRGQASRVARLTATEIELPDAYGEDSFLGLQQNAAAG